ncbi:MAG TPA: FecR domain-containing protein [Williamwhitmania sp.]|nr:FecR domain-containing protein [Williamwhitmania sp.]
MKLDENNQQHFEYIGRYLAGEMFDEERQIFEGEIDMFDENKELLAQMKKEWRLMGKYKDSKMVNTDSAWAKLADRFEEDGLLPKHTIIAKQPKRITPMLRWAAAAIVVMAVGTTWIYTSHRLKVSSQLVNLSTGSEPTALIHTLDDGSTVYLASNTSLSFPKEFDTRERKVELNGEAFFEVAHNSRQPFLIETAAATIQVLGTAFNVRSETPSTFELIVERGKVKVTLKDGSSNSFVVSAGERLAAVGSNVSVVKNSNNDYMAWRLQRMQFKDERLQDVVNVLNRNYHSSIVLASSELGNRRLTVTFSNNTLSSITDLICLALQLKSEVKSDTVIISQADGRRIK